MTHWVSDEKEEIHDKEATAFSMFQVHNDQFETVIISGVEFYLSNLDELLCKLSLVNSAVRLIQRSAILERIVCCISNSCLLKLLMMPRLVGKMNNGYIEHVLNFWIFSEKNAHASYS